MNREIDLLVTDLSYLVRDLGKDGGLTSPSIYDTAQVLRLTPSDDNIWQTLHWLLDQQQTDGGWGDPAFPLTRDVPTLAAVLAINTHCTRRRDRVALRAGIDFLSRQAIHWRAPLPDDIPAGVELLLPYLLKEAAAAGLELNHEPYEPIIALGQRRRRLIAHLNPKAGTAATHSWEAWGGEPSPEMIDGSGGIGHSPAATAAWIHRANGRADLADFVAAARGYLASAAASTGMRIAGVMPNAWPIARTEQATALYGILLANMLDHPALQDAVQPILSDLAGGITSTGLGTSDFFTPDGDDTAMALACLAGRRKVPIDPMLHFAIDSHFYTYIGELQPSLSATAHALHALALAGKPWPGANAYLHERKHPDGRWIGDKWNGSWLYTTCHTLAALLSTEAFDPTTTINSILAHQHANGGWGLATANSEETAYAVASLLQLHRAELLPTQGYEALRRGAAFLISRYRPFAEEGVAVWLAKEPYRPRRVSRAFELGATLALAVEGLV